MLASVSKFKQNSSRTPDCPPRDGCLDFPKPPALLALPADKMTFLRSVPCLFLSIIGVALAVLTGCGEDDPRLVYGDTQYLGAVYGDAPVAATAPIDNVSYWDGEGVPGKPSIKIRLGEQRAYFYKGGQLVGISQLSTGREGLDTPIGQYKITQSVPNRQFVMEKNRRFNIPGIPKGNLDKITTLIVKSRAREKGRVKIIDLLRARLDHVRREVVGMRRREPDAP